MGYESSIDQITELEGLVRNYINTHRYQVDLLKDSSNWNQICSSLDVIGDTLYAITSYHRSKFPEDSGLQYIYIYGLLQSLFVQQDGLRHLSEAFQINYKVSQTLLEIRRVRNAAIGHPSKQNQKGTCFYDYISRISMTKNGFDLLRHSEERKFDVVYVDISEIIHDQLASVAEGYKEIAKKLKEADRMHKEKYRETRLQDIFPAVMEYLFEKIGQGILVHWSGDREFGLSNLKMLKETYEKYKMALSERNELSEYTQFDLGEYFHAIKRLEEYLSGKNDLIDKSDARIYWSYLCKEHSNFVQMPKEVDEHYQI